MKRLSSILIIMIFFLLSSFGQSENMILGEWTNKDSSQVVRVDKQGDFFVGKLISLQGELQEDLLDRENKDEDKQMRKLLGIDVWLNFSYDEDKDMWKYGEIYNFKNGNTYNGKITVEGDELKLTGHYGFFFFLAKTQNWTRIKY